MTHSTSPARAGWGRPVSLVLGLAVMAAAIWLFHWTVKTSGGFNPPGEEDYYNFLVRGWRSGHLYMSKEPSPAMKALADPYDPAQNNAVRMGDASYYREHYYLYFSGAPALVLHFPYALITGKEIATTTAVFIFCTIGYLASSLTWLALQRRYFATCSWWIPPLVLAVLATSTHVLVLQRRPLVWELPLSAAYASGMAMLGALYLALHSRRPLLFTCLAGLLFGFLIACRPTCLLAAVLFTPLLWQQWKDARDRLWLKSAIGLATGIGIFGVAVLAHNYARFGHPAEFGVNYQLTSVREGAQAHFTPRYIFHNAYIYLLNPAQGDRHFPFVRAVPVSENSPPGYLGTWVEPTVGLAVSFPVVYALLVLPWLRRIRRDGDDRGLTVMILSMLLFVSAVLGMYLIFYCATPRYMTEFTPTIMMLAGIGLLLLDQWAIERQHRFAVGLPIVTLCLATIVMGLLLFMDYHNRSLQQLQPPIWKNLERVFS